MAGRAADLAAALTRRPRRGSMRRPETCNRQITCLGIPARQGVFSPYKNRDEFGLQWFHSGNEQGKGRLRTPLHGTVLISLFRRIYVSHRSPTKSPLRTFNAYLHPHHKFWIT